MKVEANSPPNFAPQEASVVTIFDEDLLSSHSADVCGVGRQALMEKGREFESAFGGRP